MPFKKQNPIYSFRKLSFLFAPILALSFFIFNPVHAEEAPEPEVFKSKVIKVIDGDTVRLKDGTLVRYLGIDSPELKKKVDDVWIYDPEPFAEAAAKFNQELVEGKEVLVEIDPAQRNDQYGRLLAYVYVDKVLVNEELIKAGLARTMIPSLFMKHRIRFWSIEEMAWTAKRGLWANDEDISR